MANSLITKRANTVRKKENTVMVEFRLEHVAT